jgi:hypothetical protein
LNLNFISRNLLIRHFCGGERQNIIVFYFVVMDDLNDEGGYSHAPDHLSYGVDMKHIRWCGILQVISIPFFVLILAGKIFNITSLKQRNFVFILLENCSSILGCGTGGDNFKKWTS